MLAVSNACSGQVTHHQHYPIMSLKAGISTAGEAVRSALGLSLNMQEREMIDEEVEKVRSW